MDSTTIAVIVLFFVATLFVPFAPLRPLKKIILFFFNRFIPLPIKFEDIGGIPIFGMRLFKVSIKLGATGGIEAEELNMKLRVLPRLLMLRRPQFNPITFYKPVITVAQAKQKGEVWFLFPVAAVKQVLSVLFSNLMGLNVVRMYGGTIIIKGKRGDTRIDDFNGEFTSHGTTMKIKRLSCRVGEGSIEIQYPESGSMHEGRVQVRNLHIEDLAALKVPRIMNGPMNVEAAMTGSLNNMELLGHIHSPCMYMRTEPILGFRSPLRFVGQDLTLEHMEGHLGEYKLDGKLVTNVETDISDLTLRGGGRGSASGSILRMLNMQPFISSAGLDADIHLWGDLNEFYEFEGDIKLDMKDVAIDFAQIGTGSMAGFPMIPIPDAFLHMTLSKGILRFEECRLNSSTLKMNADGKVVMQYDEEADRVHRSQFDMQFFANCGDLTDLANFFGMRSLNVEGSAEGNFRMFADYSNEFHALEGDGHLAFRDSRITSLPLSKRSALDGIVDIKFKNIEGDIYLEKEGMGFRNLTCSADWLDITANGYAGFFTKEMDITGDVAAVPNVIIEKPLFKAIPGARRLAEKMRMKFSMAGKTGKPKIKLHIADTLKELFGYNPVEANERKLSGNIAASHDENQE